MKAARGNHPKIVDALLAANASVDLQDNAAHQRFDPLAVDLGMCMGMRE